MYLYFNLIKEFILLFLIYEQFFSLKKLNLIVKITGPRVVTNVMADKEIARFIVVCVAHMFGVVT